MAKKVGKLQGKGVIYKANPLIVGSYKMSNRQQRLIAILAAQVESKHDDEFHTYTFKIGKLSKFLGFEDTAERYNLLRSDLRDLMSKVLTLISDTRVTLVHFVSRAEYDTKTGIVELKIDDKLKPYYLDLKNKFTRYELGQAMKFRGTYTLRFYEWLRAEEYKKNEAGWWYVSIELSELRRRLDLDARKEQPRVKMPRWVDFRRWILEPAISELNEKTDWVVNWEAEKSSRRISELKIHVGPKKPPKTKKPKASIKEPPVLDEVRKALRECTHETQENYEKLSTEKAEKLASESSLLARETIILRAREEVLEDMAERILAEAAAKKA